MNVPAYVVGGYVRDIFLKRPSEDIDIVVVGSGIEMANNVAKKLDDPKLSVFKNFGTAMLRCDNMEIEFVGARKESYRSDSRKPVVENGTLEDDLNRRDFTINALAIGLNKNNFGKLIDSFNGILDIEYKVIRTPLNPDTTFSDDPLRMLRAIRFAAQLNFEIDEKSFNAICKNKERISIISKERITDELNKIIMTKKPSAGFKLLLDSGLLEIIFPQLAKLKGIETVEGKKHKDNFYHSIQVLDNISEKSDDLWLRWTALVHDIAKPQTKKFDEKTGWTFHGHEVVGSRMVPQIFREMKLPANEKMKYVQKLVALHLRPIALTEETITDSAVRRLLFEAGNDIEDLLMLSVADITSKNPEKIKAYNKNFKLVKKKIKEVEEKDKLRNWQPPVTGNDIMKTFDIKPCYEVGVIKSAIREAILDGKIGNNHEEAYKFMLEKGKELGLTVKNIS
ncbi:MAG: HD domain-containing protein [Bacteroidales bacterium]|nr:HD domain-containing protein [Bacteroidales bacterium]